MTQSSPRNGDVTCSDVNNFQSECEFTCRHGYVLNGMATMTCLESGWDHGAPTCEGIKNDKYITK